jgi:hypothetical protein
VLLGALAVLLDALAAPGSRGARWTVVSCPIPSGIRRSSLAATSGLEAMGSVVPRDEPEVGREPRLRRLPFPFLLRRE